MIAKLTGILDSVGDEWAIIDVGGVGYIVFCPIRTLAALPQTGQPVTFHIETHVREDHIHLYGFGVTASKYCKYTDPSPGRCDAHYHSQHDYDLEMAWYHQLAQSGFVRFMT